MNTPGSTSHARFAAFLPIVYALRKYDFIVLFPVNPATLAKYREVFTHSGAKDDPTDAELALELLLKYPEKLQPLQPQSPRCAPSNNSSRCAAGWSMIRPASLIASPVP